MGSKADEPINRRLAMFVPFYMQEYFNKAQIVDKEGQARPLVAKEEKIVVTGKTPADFVSSGITPMQSASLLLDTKRENSLGHRPHTLLGCRNGWMYTGIFSTILTASGSKSQLYIICIPSISPFLPSIHAIQGTKKGNKPLYAG